MRPPPAASRIDESSWWFRAPRSGAIRPRWFDRNQPSGTGRLCRNHENREAARGADTRVCGVETRLDALVGAGPSVLGGTIHQVGNYLAFKAPGIETSLDATV